MIIQLLRYLNKSIPLTDNDSTVKNGVNDFYKGANDDLISLVNVGIIWGYGDGLHPNEILTRAQLAQILYNMITRFEKYSY